MFRLAILSLLLLLLVAAPAVAQLAPYWIPDEGCELARQFGTSMTQYYRGENSLDLSITSDHVEYHIEVYSWDGNDGLCRSRNDYPGMDYVIYRYDPPLKVLQLPLSVGATWTSESVRTRQGGGSIPRTITLSSAVVGESNVETEIGTLHVFEVTEVVTSEPGGFTDTTTRLLNDQFGDVSGLIGMDGCTTVADEPFSWGSVKSLYR